MECKPFRRNRAAFISQFYFKDLLSSSSITDRTGGEDRPDKSMRASRGQVRNSLKVPPVLVGTGVKREGILNRLDPLFGKTLGQGRPYAFDKLDRGGKGCPSLLPGTLFRIPWRGLQAFDTSLNVPDDLQGGGDRSSLFFKRISIVTLEEAVQLTHAFGDNRVERIAQCS